MQRYIDTYIHRYIDTHIHTYIHTYIHTLHYITLHYITSHYITLHYNTIQYITYTHAYIYIYTVYIHISVCVNMHVCLYAYHMKYIYAYVHICIHIYSAWCSMHVFFSLMMAMITITSTIISQGEFAHGGQTRSWPTHHIPSPHCCACDKCGIDFDYDYENPLSIQGGTHPHTRVIN